MLAKRCLALCLCLCLMIPAIGLQLVSPAAVTAAAASEGDYIVMEFACAVNHLVIANANSNLMGGVGYRLEEPLDLTQHGYSTNASQNTLALQFDMYVSGDSGLVEALENGHVGGQIEITSSGTCDQQEANTGTGHLTFQHDTWVRRTLPLSAFTGKTGSEVFDPTAFNYFRIYYAAPAASLNGQQATMKICNIRLVNTAYQAPSTVDDPIGDGTFAPEAPQWKAVEFGDGMDDSTPLVAGYNLAEYVKENNVDLLDRYGRVDYAPVVNSLLEGLEAAGGGTLYIPSGHYSFYREVRIPRGVSVCGDWASPEKDHTVKGTVIEVYHGHNDASAMPFITMGTHTQVRNLTFWYPEQRAEDIVPYPPTVRTNQYTFVQNITFVNAYFAVQQNDGANCPNVWNVYGTPLYKGLDMDVVVDIARLEEIHFAPDYWIESGLEGAPISATADRALRDHLYQNATAITLRRIDWSYLTYSDVRGYHTGLYFGKCVYSDAFPNGQCVGLTLTDCYNAIRVDNVSGSCESLADITIRNCVYGINLTASDFNGAFGSLQIVNMDIAATGAAVLQNNGVRVSMLSSTVRQGAIVSNRGHILVGDSDLLTPAPQVVLNSGAYSGILLGNRAANGGEITYANQGGCPVSYSATALDMKDYTSLSAEETGAQAKGPAKQTTYIAQVDSTGATDVTEALQALLTQAGNNGGGLVFLPPGKYRVDGALTVPTGVELRGAGDFGSMPAPINTVITVYRRGGETDDATVTLAASAGIRGITFHYPEQNSQYTPVTVNGVASYRFTFDSYPYAIRGAGSNIYVIHVSSHNGYNGVDLATNRCDGHYVDYLAGHFFHRGIVAGGGSVGGVIRNYQFNYNAILNSHSGVWGDWGAFPSVDMQAHFHLEMQRQFNNNAIVLTLGNVQNQLVYNCFNYSSLYGVLLKSENGNEPNGVRLYGHGVDYATESVRVEAGQNIEILNMQLTAFNQCGSNVTGEYAVTDKSIYDIHLTSTFTGDIAIHNFTEWAPSPTAGVRVDSGTLHLYNAALNHTNSQFFEMSSGGTVNVVGLSSGRSDTPVITAYTHRNRVKVIGGHYNTAFKVLRDGSETNYTNGSYLHQWTGEYSGSDAASGFAYTTANNRVTITGYTGSATALSVPAAIGGNPVVAIAAGAFSGKNVTAVALPETLTAIGDNAFAGCTALKGITIPSGVQTIGASAFKGCTSLTQVSLPHSVTVVNADAFSGCAALSGVIYSGSAADRAAIAVAGGNTPLTAALWTYMTCAHDTTVVRNVAEPTRLTAGYTGDTVCTLCGVVVKRGVPIDPFGYAYMDTDGGVLTTDCIVSAQASDVVLLGDGEYGLALDPDTAGITVTGALFRNIPASERVTMAIEYYIAEDLSGNRPMFRYQFGNYAATELLSGTHALQAQRSALVFHTFTAEERAVIGEEDFTFTLTGCASNVYIQSVKLVPTSSLHVEGGDYAWADLRERALCDFYSEITATSAHLMTWGDYEQDKAGYPNTDWLYRYFKVYGAAMSADVTENKPVYIKVYTNKGYENTTVSLNAFEVSNGTSTNFSNLLGYKTAVATVQNGVGGIFLPEACFANRLNGLGAFRVWYTEAPKIARVEVYDLQTACNGDIPTAVRDDLHAWMLENAYNTTDSAKGVCCATCNRVLEENHVYAKLDFSNGTLVGTAATASNYTVEQIPGTAGYGAKLYKQNQTIQFRLEDFGICEADIQNGEALAVIYEYYTTAQWANGARLTLRGNGYNLGINGSGADATWDCLGVNAGTAMTKGALDVIAFTVGSGVTYKATTGGNIGNGTTAPAGAVYDTVDTAKALVNGKTMELICWNMDNAGTSGSAIYLKSVTVCKASDLQYPPQKELSEALYFDYAISPVHYPQYAKDTSTGLTMSTGLAEYYAEDTAQQYPRFNYGYVKVNRLLSTDNTTPKDYILRIHAKEGSDLSQLVVQYQKAANNTAEIAGDERWSSYYTATFKDGMATLALDNAVFCNGLNAGASIRLRDTHYVQSGSSYVLQTNDDLDDIAWIEVAPATCSHPQTQVIGEKAATCNQTGSTGDTVCTECGKILQVAQTVVARGHTVAVDEGKAPTCTESGLTDGKHCTVCQMVLVAQEEIAASGHTEEVVKGYAPTCTEAGLTDGIKCSVCGEVLVAQQVVAMLDHTPVVDEGVAPDCTNTGLKEGAHCGVCGKILTAQEVIPVIPHDEVIDEAVAPTCTETGLTEGKHCDVCGEVLVKQELVDALGHDEGVPEGEKNAAVGVPGYTGDLVCGVCGTLLKEGEVIPAPEAKFVDGICYVNGERAYYAGLIMYEGDLYYIGDGARAVKGRHLVSNTNNIEGYEKGFYYFDVDGKMLKNVVVDGYYYGENGLCVPYRGLIKVGESYYYVIDNGAVAKGRYFVSNTNNIEGYTNGFCYFDETGAMVGTGVYEGYYYENGQEKAYAGMIKIGEDTHYILIDAMAKTGRYAIVKNNGFKKGIYYFDEEGKMLKDVVVDGYYYGKDGLSLPYLGLVKVGESYYCVIDSGKVVKGRYFIRNTNGIEGFSTGYYYFGEDGKMMKNVVVDGYYYGDDGLCAAYRGLVLANDGNYYYVINNGMVVCNNPYFYVTNPNGYVNRGFYSFDENGAIVLIATKDELTAALARGGYITLAANIEVNGVLTIPEGATLNGNNYTLKGATLIAGNGSAVNNLNMDGTSAKGAAQLYAENGSVTMKTVLFQNPDTVSVEVVNGADVTIHSSTFIDVVGNASQFVNATLANGTLTMTQNFFVGVDAVTDTAIVVNGAQNVTVFGNKAVAQSKEAAEAACVIEGYTGEAFEIVQNSL